MSSESLVHPLWVGGAVSAEFKAEPQPQMQLGRIKSPENASSWCKMQISFTSPKLHSYC